ncbi:unnamed protein product [Ectocarpus sp. 6 AP-2014]
MLGLKPGGGGASASQEGTEPRTKARPCGTWLHTRQGNRVPRTTRRQENGAFYWHQTPAEVAAVG